MKEKIPHIPRAAERAHSTLRRERQLEHYDLSSLEKRLQKLGKRFGDSERAIGAYRAYLRQLLWDEAAISPSSDVEETLRVHQQDSDDFKYLLTLIHPQPDSAQKRGRRSRDIH